MPQVSLTELITAARSGSHLVSFPTDTVPALAVRPDQAALIFAAKQRSETKPLILMGGEVEDLWPYVQGSAAEQEQWQAVAARYFPGALTLVLPASDRLPPAMNPTDSTTLGIRVPNHPIARQILRQTQPLATTSVNRSGQPPLLTLDDINIQFPEVLTLSQAEFTALERHYAQALAQPAQPSSSGLPSTVVQWTAQGWKILRQGEIKLESPL